MLIPVDSIQIQLLGIELSISFLYELVSILLTQISIDFLLIDLFECRKDNSMN